MKELSKDIFIMGVRLNDKKQMLDEQFARFFDENKKSKKKINIQFTIRDIVNNPNEVLELIQNLSLTYNVNPTNCMFSVATNGILPEKVLKKIESFNLKLNDKYKNSILILDCDTYFDFDDVKKVSEEIYAFGKRCRLNKLTPLEALLWCYATATKRRYNAENENEGSGISRSIYGVLTTNKIVCVGYVNLIINYISSYYSKRIATFYNSTKVKTQEGINGHSSLIIYINDNIYGINGYYLLDPTKDNVLKGKGINLNNFLIPLCDLQYTKAQYLDYHTSGKYIQSNSTYPKKQGFFFYPPEDRISLSQQGLSFIRNSSFKYFCDENIKCNPEFRLLNDMVEDSGERLEFDNSTQSNEIVENFVFSNSKPITYLTLQKLIYNTMVKTHKEQDESFLWSTSQKIMRYNTDRARLFFNNNPNIKNPFYQQYYAESIANEELVIK